MAILKRVERSSRIEAELVNQIRRMRKEPKVGLGNPKGGGEVPSGRRNVREREREREGKRLSTMLLFPFPYRL